MGASDVAQFLAVFDLSLYMCVTDITQYLNLEPLFLIRYLEAGILLLDLQFSSGSHDGDLRWMKWDWSWLHLEFLQLLPN